MWRFCNTNRTCPLWLAVLIVSIPAICRAQALDVVHAFGDLGTEEPAYPMAGLTLGNDGNFYGISPLGGEYGLGTVFTVTPAGIVRVLYSFDRGDIGNSRAGLLLASDGYLYGAGRQAIFRISRDGVFGFLGSPFSRITAPPLEGADGLFYFPFTDIYVYQDRPAILLKRINSPAAAFSYCPVTIQPNLPGITSALARASDGNLYGVFSRGGTLDQGVIFKFSPITGICAIVYEFGGTPEGALPRSLATGTDGNLYGTTQAGGSSDAGTVFRMALDGQVSVLHEFTGLDGRAPIGALMQATDGNFYGTAEGGPLGEGVIYRMTPGGGVSLVHAFAGGDAEGAVPQGTLVQTPDGTFYGTTRFGGPAETGTIFSMSPAGAVTVLHAFGRPRDASLPAAALTEDADGNLYGTTAEGGIYSGTIFRVTRDGRFRLVYSLDGVDGTILRSAMTLADDGDYYGVAESGLPQNVVVIASPFRVSRSGTFSSLVRFDITASTKPLSAGPFGSLVQAPDGYLYGTTSSGGSGAGGVVYRMSKAGDVAVLHAFTGADGAIPRAGLVLGADGNLFGTTSEGGAFNRGTVFRITPSGAFTLLYSFTGAGDGAYPMAPLLRARDGNFYGTTSGNGLDSVGTVFRLSPASTLTTLHVFNGTDGASPQAGLIEAADGYLYGTTSGGGFSRAGTVFRVGLDGSFALIASFNPRSDGAAPLAGLIQASDGHLYGTASTGGPPGQGTVFRIRLAAGPLTPTSLTVSSLAGRIRLSWNAVATATSYQIRRGVSSGHETVIASGVAGITFDDTTAAPGRRYYYVVTALNAVGESTATYEVSMTAGQLTRGDFDGDGQADITIYRPTTAGWWVLKSATNYGTYNVYGWGVSGDKPVPADYDGDGKSDVAIYRPSTGEWWILWSSSNYATYSTFGWGLGGDIPVPADYDGDGRTDLAIYRPSTTTWWILWSSSDYTTYSTFDSGLAGDVPVPGDYDGDGLADIATYRPSTGEWWILTSSSSYASYTTRQWGLPGDIPVAADYDGDGKTDLAIYRPTTQTWWVLRSSSNNNDFTVRQWGLNGDVPVPADYDGDGQTDFAVYRPSTAEWWILLSSTNNGFYATYRWGLSGDIAVLARQ